MKFIKEVIKIFSFDDNEDYTDIDLWDIDEEI